MYFKIDLQKSRNSGFLSSFRSFYEKNPKKTKLEKWIKMYPNNILSYHSKIRDINFGTKIKTSFFWNFCFFGFWKKKFNLFLQISFFWNKNPKMCISGQNILVWQDEIRVHEVQPKYFGIFTTKSKSFYRENDFVEWIYTGRGGV